MSPPPGTIGTTTQDARPAGVPAGWSRDAGGLYVPSDSIRRDSDQQSRRSGPRLSFDGSRDDRWTEHWLAADTDPIELITTHLPKLRARARAHERNAPWFTSIVNTWVDQVVGAGSGWTLQQLIHKNDEDDDLDQTRNRIVERWWNRFITGVDVNRRESLRMFLRTAEREFAVVGEYFIRMRIVRDAHPIPLALELIPSERLDVGLDRPAGTDPMTGRPINRITQGIEFDEAGRRVAYHFDDLDERGRPRTFGGSGRIRVTADRVQHRYLKIRAGQERGVPPMYAALLLMHDFDNAIDYEMEGWQAQARIIGGVKRKGAGIVPDGGERDAVDDRPVHRVAGASLLDLHTDEELVFAPATRPHDKLQPWVEFAWRTLGKTVGFSYEATTGDYSKVNFASGRLGSLADRRNARRHQEELDHLSLRPIHTEFMWHLISAGRLPGVSITDFLIDPHPYLEHRFIYPGWEHHDPVTEAVAAGLRVLLGLSTRQEEAAALGRDWYAIIVQLEREMASMDDHGIPMVTVGGSQKVSGGGMTVDDASDNPQAPTPPSAPDDDEDDDTDDGLRSGKRGKRRGGRGAFQLDVPSLLAIAAHRDQMSDTPPAAGGAGGGNN